MTYHAKLFVDLEFHSYPDLDAAFAEAGARPAHHLDRTQQGVGWPIIAPISEFAQADPELLVLLADAGVRPGARVAARLAAGRLELRATAGDTVSVEPEVADHVFVAAE